jgi:pilus assembly protein CpaB
MKAARLIVLGIAVAAGGLAAILAGGYQSAPPPAAPPPPPQIAMVDILVAKNDIGIGVTLSAGDLQWQTWPASAGNPAFVRKSEHPDAIQQYTGAIVRVAMAAGEPVRENKIIKANGSGFLAAILPAGMRATSVPISVDTGAGGFILPNDRVDVILAGRDREAEKANGYETRVGVTILTDVRVLAIDQTVQEKDGQRVVVGKTATIEVTEAQAELLQAALQSGSLSLTLRSLADASPSSRPQTAIPSRSADRFNMIRFGVPTTATAR